MQRKRKPDNLGGNPPKDEYPVKTALRAQGFYPREGGTEEESNYVCALGLMEMLMDGKCTMFTHEGDCLDAEDAARTAADAWDTDADRLLAKAREWEPLIRLRREDPDSYRREMSKKLREWAELDGD